MKLHTYLWANREGRSRGRLLNVSHDVPGTAESGLLLEDTLASFQPPGWIADSHTCSGQLSFGTMNLLGSSAGKEFACNAGDPGSITGSALIHWRRDRLPTPVFLGFPGGSGGKESACNVGDLGSIPRLGRSPGEGNGYRLQYSCLENPMDQRSLEGYRTCDHKELDTSE